MIDASIICEAEELRSDLIILTGREYTLDQIFEQMARAASSQQRLCMLEETVR